MKFKCTHCTHFYGIIIKNMLTLSYLKNFINSKILSNLNFSGYEVPDYTELSLEFKLMWATYICKIYRYLFRLCWFNKHNWRMSWWFEYFICAECLFYSVIVILSYANRKFWGFDLSFSWSPMYLRSFFLLNYQKLTFWTYALHLRFQAC